MGHQPAQNTEIDQVLNTVRSFIKQNPVSFAEQVQV